MVKILFVCLGNICRSPMAEFVFRDLACREGLNNDFTIASAATSAEAEGCPVHKGTRQKLMAHGIVPDGKIAVRLQKSDYDKYDYIIGMEESNISNMLKLFGEDKDKKIYRLLDFTAVGGNIADPWYTGNFDETYSDVLRGCTALLKSIIKKPPIAGLT